MPDREPAVARARRAAWLLVALAAVWLAGLWWLERGQALYDDEIAFVRAARVLNTPDPTRYVIPHPPLVVHLMAAGLALPLASEQALRIVGLGAGLATLALLPPAARALLPGDTVAERQTAWLAGGLAAVIYAATPLAVQAASLIDIDNSWLIPLTLAPFAFWSAWPAGRPARRFGLALLLALALWAKLLTTPFVPLALGLHALLRRDRRDAADVAVATALAAALFGVTLALYAAVLRFPLEQFAVTFAKSGDVGGLAAVVRRALQGGGILLFWLSLPLGVLWLVASGQALVRLLRRRPWPLDALALFAWIVLAFYLLVRELPYGFPRYHAVMLPAFALMTAWPGALWARQSSWRLRLALPALAALAALYAGLVVGDPLLAHYRLTFETTDLVARLSAGLAGVAQTVLPVLALWLIVSRLRPATGREAAGWPAQALMLALLAAGMGQAVATVLAQARADYALRYSYGRAGTWETVALVRQRVPPGELVAPPEILYHAGRTGQVHYALFCPDCKPEPLVAQLRARVAAVILTEKESRRYTQVSAAPAVQAELSACYRRDTAGSYIIYSLEPRCRPSPS